MLYRERLAEIDGLTFSDCVRFFGEHKTARDKEIVALAQTETREGELEIDDPAIVSEGDDNGAYVLAWLWVDFAGTPLDKDAVVHLELEAGDGSALCGAVGSELPVQLAAVGPEAGEPTFQEGNGGDGLCRYCLATWRTRQEASC